MNKLIGKRMIGAGFALITLAATLGLTSCASSSKISIFFVTPQDLPDATIHVGYSTNVAADGVTGPPTGTYTYSCTGTLPPGIGCTSHSIPGNNNNSVSYVIIHGTPTHTGTYTFTVKAEDDLTPPTVGTEQYTIVVN